MRRELVNRIGGLDEDFGLGFYEDDDYCLRSLREGLRLVCLEDAFVYHRGSHSFQRQPTEETKSLMKRNHSLFEAKHQLTYRPLRAWKRHLELAEDYLQAAKGSLDDRVLLKVDNRLRMASLCRPKSAFKRIAFRFRHAALERRVSRLPERAKLPPPSAARPT